MRLQPGLRFRLLESLPYLYSPYGKRQYKQMYVTKKKVTKF